MASNCRPFPSAAASAHEMPYGATLQSDGSTRFRLWAPAQTHVDLVVEGAPVFSMTSSENGWHELTVPEILPGSRYSFRLADGTIAPDPASRYQPEDVHGPSEVIDPSSYVWRTTSWRGRPWHEAIIYELHVGAFTSEGTFRATIERLDHLVELGITAIELMPIAAFPGTRSWGYDGVLMFAPDATYGRPEDLKTLIDAAHEKGLMVLLDVVYNHFGPDGNYLPVYAPQVFTDRHKTPWGNAINYDGPDSRPVREFVLHNALYWLEEFRLDGLRLDAVHAIVDDSEMHLLEELAERVDRLRQSGRQIHLILENEENDARRLERERHPFAFTAQWNDDVHHGLHCAATGENGGYYAEYHGDAAKLGRALAEGFAFQGEAYRGVARGHPSSHLPPTAFISFVQNHDQVGNRAFGDRITATTRRERVRAIASVYLLAPQIPMLFMGEEWAASQRFPFFCDFEGELAEAVRRGRRAEFAQFPEFANESARQRIPDPTSPESFLCAKLSWEDRTRDPHSDWLGWYRRILSVRKEEIVPRLSGMSGSTGAYQVLAGGGLTLTWQCAGGNRLRLVANLSEDPLRDTDSCAGRLIWREGSADLPGGVLPPWGVSWTLQE